MKRWSCGKGKIVEDAKINAFFKEVLEVCKKHGLSIGHEGAFQIVEHNDYYVSWLEEAHDARGMYFQNTKEDLK